MPVRELAREHCSPHPAIQDDATFVISSHMHDRMFGENLLCSSLFLVTKLLVTGQPLVTHCCLQWSSGILEIAASNVASHIKARASAVPSCVLWVRPVRWSVGRATFSLVVCDELTCYWLGSPALAMPRGVVWARNQCDHLLSLLWPSECRTSSAKTGPVRLARSRHFSQ